MSTLRLFYPGGDAALLVGVVVVQVTVAAALAVLAASTVFRRRAAARHAVCLAALVSLLLSPLLAYVFHRGGVTIAQIPIISSRADGPVRADRPWPPDRVGQDNGMVTFRPEGASRPGDEPLSDEPPLVAAVQPQAASGQPSSPTWTSSRRRPLFRSGRGR